VSTPEVPPAPDAGDLRGLARGLRLLVEIAARTLTEEAAPVVIGIRDESRFGPPFCDLEILAADRSAATAMRDEIERLMRVHYVRPRPIHRRLPGDGM
jgi:hypothetical protein